MAVMADIEGEGVPPSRGVVELYGMKGGGNTRQNFSLNLIQ